MKTSILAACLLVITTVITTAAENPLCSVELPGCGAFAAGKPCICIGNMDEASSLELELFCALTNSTEGYSACCPCTEPAVLSSEGSSGSSGGSSLQSCISEGNLEELRRLFLTVRTISLATIERCGVPVTDECAGERVLTRLDCLFAEIRFVVEDINIECGLGQTP